MGGGIVVDVIHQGSLIVAGIIATLRTLCISGNDATTAFAAGVARTPFVEPVTDERVVLRDQCGNCRRIWIAHTISAPRRMTAPMLRDSRDIH